MQIPVTQEYGEFVHWWLQEERWLSRVPLQVPPPSLLLYTDASLTGWGTHLLNLTVAGVWFRKERDLHINVL